MLRKLRHAMGNQDRRYRMKELVDVALVDSKRGPGALPSLNTFADHCQQQSHVTPPRLADD